MLERMSHNMNATRMIYRGDTPLNILQKMNYSLSLGFRHRIFVLGLEHFIKMSHSAVVRRKDQFGHVSATFDYFNQ